MGIERIGASGSAAGGQMPSIQPVDTVRKNLENKMMNVQRQMQELSSKEELPAQEKIKKQQELQQELSRLNAQLRQHEAQVNREKRKEALADAGKEEKGADQPDIDTGVSFSEAKPLMGAKASMEQVRDGGRIVAKIENGIAILKGEIRRDEARGVNTDKKEEELARQEERAQRIKLSQSAVLGEARQAMQEGQPEGSRAAGTKQQAQNGAGIQSTNYAKEADENRQWQIHVSTGADDVFAE